MSVVHSAGGIALNIQILTVPYDSGQYGVRMGRGPGRLLEAGLEARLAGVGHTTWVSEIRMPHVEVPSEIGTAFGLMARLSEAVSEAVAHGRFPVVLSGVCYSCVGTLAGIGSPVPGVVWFDSHGDLNTPETTGSGFLDGMALTTLVGHCWSRLASTVPGHQPVPEDSILMMGVRDLDAPEAALLERGSIEVRSVEEVRDDLEATLQVVERVSPLYIHLDLDVLDPSEGRANALAAPNGFLQSELIDLLHHIRDRAEPAALGVTAYDPALDASGSVCAAALDAIIEVVGS